MERTLRRLELLPPPGYHGERRQFAAERQGRLRHATVWRNQVWQLDFCEFENQRWRNVVDGRGLTTGRNTSPAGTSPPPTRRDASAINEATLTEAEALLGHALIDNLVDTRPEPVLDPARHRQ